MIATHIQQICILGSTGSVGESTLAIVRQHPQRYRIHALSAYHNVDLLWQQCLEFKPQQVVLVDELAAAAFREKLATSTDNRLSHLQVLQGENALVEIATHEKVDAVMASIVGAAGLPSSLAAARAGKRILLANKESLVMSGALFMSTVRQYKAELLPVDSEHNAIFQCLASNRGDGCGNALEIRKIILTASGGPFLATEKEDLLKVTPAQACKHPKWDMGRKISVDSATLMNKGLELIEACLLFDLKPEQVEVLIHPESIIHSMVEYCDGSVIAQMANPDMKIPIAYSLSWPERITTGVDSLDLLKVQQLNFQPPDLDRFPCLALAYRALSMGAHAINALNAANEIAVEAFLSGRIPFTGIAGLIASVLDEVAVMEEAPMQDLRDVLAFDRHIREISECLLSNRHAPPEQTQNRGA